MSRWIDAEWLRELYKPYESYNGKELAVPIGAILANIDDAPSIDIVRCKECKHYNSYESTFGKGWFCWRDNVKRNADDFCSYGERKDDE